MSTFILQKSYATTIQYRSAFLPKCSKFRFYRPTISLNTVVCYSTLLDTTNSTCCMVHVCAIFYFFLDLSPRLAASDDFCFSVLFKQMYLIMFFVFLIFQELDILQLNNQTN